MYDFIGIILNIPPLINVSNRYTNKKFTRPTREIKCEYMITSIDVVWAL